MELTVWIVSLLSVFGAGWAMGRASRRPVYVTFPEMRPITAIKPTAAEVTRALRTVNREESA